MADDLVITTNEPDNLVFLHAEFPQYLRIQLVCDAFDYRGALPGLYTALQAARNPYVAVVACDMVFASASLVVAEALAMNESGADVVVPVNKHGYEPFHAMYRRMGCLPAVRRALDRGEKRAQAFFDDVKVLEFPQSKRAGSRAHGRLLRQREHARRACDAARGDRFRGASRMRNRCPNLIDIVEDGRGPGKQGRVRWRPSAASWCATATRRAGSAPRRARRMP